MVIMISYIEFVDAKEEPTVFLLFNIYSSGLYVIQKIVRSTSVCDCTLSAVVLLENLMPESEACRIREACFCGQPAGHAHE